MIKRNHTQFRRIENFKYSQWFDETKIQQEIHSFCEGKLQRSRNQNSSLIGKREREMQNNKDTVGNPYCKLLFSNLPLAFLFFNSSSVSFKDKQPYKDPQKNGVLGLVSEFQLEKRPVKQSMFQLPAKSNRDSAKTFWFSHGQDDSTTQVAIQSWICYQLRLESCNSTKSLLSPKSTRSNTEVIRIQRKSWKFQWKTEEGKKVRWKRSRGLHYCTYSCAMRLASFFTNAVGKAVIVGRQSWIFVDDERLGVNEI